jgi:putative phosphoribosyl transferase
MRLIPTSIRTGPLELHALLGIPERARGWVIFAHGSGSSRRSPRNQQVARALLEAGIGALLLDLLTERESLVRENTFDIPLLAERLKSATHWLRTHHAVEGEPIGYFGSSTGAAAALIAAADLGTRISAIVSRGGRPDLARARLRQVRAATMLIVGGADSLVLELNRRALLMLPRASIRIIEGAGHLFEEPGALEQVGKAAAAFFRATFQEVSSTAREPPSARRS